MKKNLILFLTAVMLIFSACGQEVKKEGITPQRPDCNVSVSYNDTDYSARIKYGETGVMTVEMLSPLAGITVTEDDSGCLITYDGLELNYTTEEAKNFCPFIGLYSVLKTVCYTVPEMATATSDEYVLKYQTPEISCTAKSDKSSGSLREIETGDMKFIFK